MPLRHAALASAKPSTRTVLQVSPTWWNKFETNLDEVVFLPSEKGAFRPQLVFLDIGIPGMSGVDVARALRALADDERRFPVALTGWGAPA